jgi:adenine-specific DNA methylase
MIPKECKRLAEVDFPIAVVSKHSAREKSIRHGHPSTLHLWWARRPLGACRAVLLGLLLPDPCDPNCPEEFKPKARKALEGLLGIRPGDEGLQRALLTFIGDVANWDVANHPRWIEAARDLVKAAHPEEPPLVVDPFAGGGSIPLEALRLGCEAFASDLNPVACLILKVMLEDIPRHGPELAEELRRVGAEIKKQAEKELAEFYPTDPDGSKPIAYLWARTVRCESPNCGAEIPLMRSFWLCKKPNRKRALRSKVLRSSPSPQPSPTKGRGSEGVPYVEFEIFEPKTEKDVPNGTVTRAKATCFFCGTVLSPDRVRAQLAEQRGGADVIFDEKGHRTGGARMWAVVILKPDEQGRHYRLPTDHDYEAIWKAQQRLKEIEKTKLPNGLSPVPDEPLPPIGTLGFRVQRYGMLKWGDLFTMRQKVGLVGLGNLLCEGNESTMPFLACGFSRVAMSNMSCTRWNAVAEKMQHTFGRQALPIVWDFAEIVPIVEAPGNWQSGYELIADVISLFPQASQIGQAQNADACESPLVDDSCLVWFTDPPYYDAIPYSDLSDFFFVWLKRMLPGHPLLRDPFDPSNPLTPKLREAVQDETKKVNGRPKDRSFFEETMAASFSEGRRVLREDGIGSVVFAHKTTEGWEALLTGMIRGGWTITGSWPIATEMGSRLRARESAALATSVHLICRPRPEDAPVGDWGQVLKELPKRVGDWMERLQSEGVRGADLVFACIGPALEIFSRYTSVETAEGREVKLAEYLEKVWEVVGREALEQILGTAEAKARNGAAGALEEDARLTALFLWTLQSTSPTTNGKGSEEESSPSGKGQSEGDEDEGLDDDEEEGSGSSKTKPKGFTLVFDVVRRFAQPLGISLPKWEDRVIKTEKGVVRLLPLTERSKTLFGEDGAQAVADYLETAPTEGPMQLTLFGMTDAPKPKPKRRGKGKGLAVTDEDLEAPQEATTLDRVHMAMLLQRGGKTNALRNLLKSEQERGPEFLRLANALSALYPKGSEEKRLLDAMLLAAPR